MSGISNNVLILSFIPVVLLTGITGSLSESFDTFPHCGVVITLLSITELSHKELYLGIFIQTAVITSIAIIICIGLANIGIV